MGNSKSPGSDDVRAQSAFSASAMLATIGDTTWRMLVPSVGFTLLGVWLDGVFDTKPWLMFAGILVGFTFAILLVAKQIKKGAKL